MYAYWHVEVGKHKGKKEEPNSFLLSPQQGVNDGGKFNECLSPISLFLCRLIQMQRENLVSPNHKREKGVWGRWEDVEKAFVFWHNLVPPYCGPGCHSFNLFVAASGASAIRNPSPTLFSSKLTSRRNNSLAMMSS